MKVEWNEVQSVATSILFAWFGVFWLPSIPTTKNFCNWKIFSSKEDTKLAVDDYFGGILVFLLFRSDSRCLDWDRVTWVGPAGPWAIAGSWRHHTKKPVPYDSCEFLDSRAYIVERRLATSRWELSFIIPFFSLFLTLSAFYMLIFDNVSIYYLSSKYNSLHYDLQLPFPSNFHVQIYIAIVNFYHKLVSGVKSYVFTSDNLQSK